jgi:hypothetical protein
MILSRPIFLSLHPGASLVDYYVTENIELLNKLNYVQDGIAAVYFLQDYIQHPLNV